MKKKILIIRSVSFQQLDKNLTAIVKQFPPQEYEIHLMTHSHGLERAKSYGSISKIIDYDSRKNFNFFHLPKSLKQKQPKYHTILVPVTNKSGVGFLNVLTLTLRIPSQSIYFCNLVSEMTQITRTGIMMQMIRAALFSSLAAVITIPMAILTLPFLLVSLKMRKR
jgi:hypothetical protein